MIQKAFLDTNTLRTFSSFKSIGTKITAFLTAASLLLTGCSGLKTGSQTSQELAYTDMLFDTVIKIQILDSSDETILDGLKKLCKKCDTMFSTTNEDSELYRLNHAMDSHSISLPKLLNLFRKASTTVRFPTVLSILPSNPYLLSGISKQTSWLFRPLIRSPKP